MFENFAGGKQGLFFVVFGLVTATLVGICLWVIFYIGGIALEDENAIVVDDAASPIYVNFQPEPESVVSEDSYLAMGQYQAEFPMPQNVVVLEGLTTVEVIGYMLNHFSGGLGVNCTHCHSLDNFAADEWDDPIGMRNKMVARQHLVMTGDINQNWLQDEQLVSLTEVKQPSGSVMACATCHQGQPQPVAWAESLDVLPDDFRLPLDTTFSVTELGSLNVNARDDEISLETVQLNQYAMYHMNDSLGVGCTHCHNSRYFPSYEGVPAKNYALHMLQMSAYINDNYSKYIGGQEPSCSLCHAGQVIPYGAARNDFVLPPHIRSDPPEGLSIEELGLDASMYERYTEHDMSADNPYYNQDAVSEDAVEMDDTGMGG